MDDNPDAQLAIAHVLFLDIVGYSKLLTNEQRERLQELNRIVRETEPFRAAEAADKLVRLATGDGMVLAFFTSPDAPVRCALAISRALRSLPNLPLRMGIHSGPVDAISDVNDRPNVAGAGINVAQRVMDCGDAGHILLSKRSADDLAQYGTWQPHLHDLGEAKVKHGVRIGVVNFYGDDFGNPESPEKLKRIAQLRRRRKGRAIGAAALALISLGALWWFVAHRASPSPKAVVIPEKSIAVLPFDNFSDDKESTYFADGVQDDILTDLAKVADLKVISRHSVAQFRDTKQDIRDIGKTLGVAYVLEGSVRKAGHQIRVTAQLIDARTDAHKWAEHYDRDLADLFAIQSEISQTIAAQLQAALSPSEKAAIEKQPTADLEAYDLYLRARAIVYDFSAIRKTREEDLPKAEAYLEKAIARDPKFVLAYCLLSDVERELYWSEHQAPARLAKAQAAVDNALRIAPDSGQAHLALAFHYRHALQDKARAEPELAIAAQKLPNNVDVYGLRADLAQARGEWKNALRDSQKATQLDPHDPDLAAGLADLYRNLRRYADAERELDRMIAILPHQSSSALWREKSGIALCRGDTKTAMAALDSSPNRKIGLAGLNFEVANILMLDRKYAEAVDLIEKLPEIARSHNLLPKAGIEPIVRGMHLMALGTMARAQGQTEKARTLFANAREQFATHLAAEKTDAPWPLAWLAVSDAGAGRKEEALREIEHATEAWPKSRDAGNASFVATQVAVVKMWTGDHDGAIRQLQAIVNLPGALDPGHLKLSPQWDDLRADPRFGEVIAAVSHPVKLE